MRYGTKGAGASFVNIGQAGAIDIQKIEITGYNPEDGSDGDVAAMTLDNAGRTVASYFWVDVVDGSDVFHGWYDDDGNLVEGVTVLPGEALCFDAASGDFAIKSAGEVPTQNIAVQLRFGTKLVANPTPVAVDINDTDNGVTISGYNSEDGSDGDVSAMALDEAGRTVANYFWVDVIDGSDVFYGWYDDDGNLLTDVVLQPGETLCFDAPDDTFYVNFKGVDIK